MSDYSLTNETVFPSVNDIAGATGDGKVLKELELTRWRRTGGMQNHRVTGLAVSAWGSTGITVASGEAFIEGYFIQCPSINVSLETTDTTENYASLKLNRDGSSKIDDIRIQVSTSTSQPSESIFLSRIQHDGTAITALLPQDRKGKAYRKSPIVQVFTANGTFTPPDDVTEVYVEVYGAGGGGGGGGSVAEDAIGNGGTNGGDGANGGFCYGSVNVTPGVGVTVTVGSGGSGGTAGAAGSNGGGSSFAAPDGTLTAGGGNGGYAGNDGFLGVSSSGEPGATMGTGTGGDGIVPGGGSAGGKGGGGAVSSSATTSDGGSGAAGGDGRVVVYY